MTDRIESLEKKYRDAYMGFYQHIHQHPELSYHEAETSSYVTEILKKLPLDDIRTNVGGYGVVALLKGAEPGPVVALRADMDALPIKENTGVPFASVNNGVMHACGHDAHTSMLLGIVHVLCGMKNEIAGNIKFIFQPSEENTPTGGAPGMIKDGALENPKVDAMIAMHVWPSFKVGTMGVQPGVVSACSDHLKITVMGKAAHGSMPDEGIDAIVAASSVINALQSIISRNVCPRETAVITIGTISGGSAYNVIPYKASLEGTVRSFSQDVHEKLPDWIKRAVTHSAEAYGASTDIDYQIGYPSVLNDPEIVGVCRDAVRETLGDKGLMPDISVPPIGEDFAFFSRAVPAAFAWIGCCPEGVKLTDMPALHNDKFIPDPGALPAGVRYAAAAALKLLSALKK